MVRLRYTSPLAGRSFARVTVLPLLVVIGWLLPAIPLLVAGRFLPVPMVLIAAPLTAFLMVATLREVPNRWLRPLRPAGDAGPDAAGADTGANADAAGAGADAGPDAAGADADAGSAGPHAGPDAAGADADASADAGSAGPDAAGADADASADAGSAVPDAGPDAGSVDADASADARSAGVAHAENAQDAENADNTLMAENPQNPEDAGGSPGAEYAPYATYASYRDVAHEEYAPYEDVWNAEADPADPADAPEREASARDAAVAPERDAAAPERDADAPERDVAERDAADAPESAAAEVPEPAAAAAERRSAQAWAAWWGLGGTVAVAAGFAAWQILLNSPQIIVLRDPGALFQFGYWIAEHGSLPIPQSLGAFGGSHPGLTFSSPGFSQQEVAVVPQFMAGLPMILAAGFWLHGIAGAALISPILGAFAVLSFGGLAGRLAGPQWAPAAALVLALTLPEQYTSRSAFGEPLVQVLLFGGLCLLIDSLALDGLTPRAAGHVRPPWPGSAGRGWLAPSTAAAAIGGFALGLASLVLIGSLAVVAPAVLFIGALVAWRRYQAVPFGGGLLIGAGCGLAAGYLLAPSYLRARGHSLRDLGLIVAGLVVVAAVGVAVAWYGPARQRARRLFAGRPLRWLPDVAGVLCVAAAIGFAVRPFVQTVRGHASPGSVAYVAALQRLLHLPVDPTRLYAERSLYWVIWYVGVPAVLLGGFGIALLTRRCLRALLTWRDADGTARLWALPLMIIGWGTVSVLWRPGTVPDQPWASRRLVPVLLPGLILCAIWVSSWLAVRARERGAGPGALCAAAACFVVALVLPTALATFGFGLTFASPQGSARSATGGLALNRTGPGQAAAVTSVCGTLSASTTVVILDRVAADQFSQVIRGMCDVPTGVVAGASPAQVQAVLSGITSAARRAVLIGSGPAEFARYGVSPSKVLDFTTTQDAHELTQPPTAPWQIRYVLWELAPGSSLTGT